MTFLTRDNLFTVNSLDFALTTQLNNYAVLSIIDQVQLAIESHEYSCGIFQDFGKAFDTLNHQILLTKLDYYGIRGVVKDWFTSYLSNRTHAVCFSWCH